jgi:hypothetical protein
VGALTQNDIVHHCIPDPSTNADIAPQLPAPQLLPEPGRLTKTLRG